MVFYFLSSANKKDENMSSDIDEVNISWESSSDMEHDIDSVPIMQRSNVVTKLNFDNYEDNDVFSYSKEKKKINDMQSIMQCQKSLVKDRVTNNLEPKKHAEFEESRFTISEVTSPELNSKNSYKRTYKYRTGVRKRGGVTKTLYNDLHQFSCRFLLHSSPTMDNKKNVITEVKSPELKTKLTDYKFMPEINTSYNYGNNYCSLSPELGSKHTDQEKYLMSMVDKEIDISLLNNEQKYLTDSTCEVNTPEKDSSSVKTNNLSSTGFKTPTAEALNFECDSHALHDKNLLVVGNKKNKTSSETVIEKCCDSDISQSPELKKYRPSKTTQNIVSAMQESVAVFRATSPELGCKLGTSTTTENISHSKNAPLEAVKKSSKSFNISDSINIDLEIYSASKKSVCTNNSLKIVPDNIVTTHANDNLKTPVKCVHEITNNKKKCMKINENIDYCKSIYTSKSSLLFSEQRNSSSENDKSKEIVSKCRYSVKNSITKSGGPQKNSGGKCINSPLESLYKMNNAESWQNIESKRLKLQDYVMKLVNTPSRRKVKKSKLQSKDIPDSDSPILSYNPISTPKTCSGISLSCRRKLTELINMSVAKTGNKKQNYRNSCVENVKETECRNDVHQEKWVKYPEDFVIPGKERYQTINESSDTDPSSEQTFGSIKSVYNNPPINVDVVGEKISELRDITCENMYPLGCESSIIENVSSQEFKNTVQEDGGSSYTKHISPVCTQQMVLNKEMSSQDTSSSTSSSIKLCQNNVGIIDMDSAKKKRRRWKKNSLGGRLQKLLARQKSLANILQYESNLLNNCTTVNRRRRRRNVFFTVQQCSIEYCRLIVRCCFLPAAETNDFKMDSNNEDDLWKYKEVTTSGTNTASIVNDVILVLNPDTVRLPNLQKSTILNVYPPWEAVTIPSCSIKIILSITHVEVVHIPTVVSSVSPIQYARVLKQYSCACIKARHGVKGCLFQLPNNGYEIMKEIYFEGKYEEVTKLIPATQPLNEFGNNKDEGTIISVVNSHSRALTNSFFLMVMVDKVFCYRHAAITLNSVPLTQGESCNLMWSVLGHDINQEYCEIILGPYPSDDSFIVPNTRDSQESQSQFSEHIGETTNDNILHITDNSNNNSSAAECNFVIINDNSVENCVSVNATKCSIQTNQPTKYFFKISRDSIGKVLKFNGFTLTKKVPFSVISGFCPFVNKVDKCCTSKSDNSVMKISASESIKLFDSTKQINVDEKIQHHTKQFLYVFSPASDIWYVTEEFIGENWTIPQGTSAINLSQALTQCQTSRYMRFTVLCVLIQFFENNIYVTDDSLTGGYTCVTVKSLCYIPQKVETNSTRVILLQDILGHNGSILADKYSSVISYDTLNIQKNPNEEKLKILRKLKIKIPFFVPMSVEKSLVQLSGNIVGLDEDTAYEWAECSECGTEIFEELHSRRYCCKRCMKMVETLTKRSLVVTMTSTNLPSHYNVKVKLLQDSINKLLGAPSPEHTEYDPVSYLGQEFGPLMCLVMKSQKFENHRNLFYLQEISPATESS